MNQPFRIGHGYDVHRLVEGRKCIICGVEIPNEKGLLGHSDADVALHALSDAIVGALALGDIGKHFPDSDPAYKDADSKKLLMHIVSLMRGEGYVVGNADVTIIAQEPKMAPYIQDMKSITAGILGCCEDQLNVNATTEERLGFTGAGEGISAHAVCLIEKN